MDLSGNISNLVFKKKIKSDIGEFSLDSQMLKLLMSIDGKKTIDSIEKQLNLDTLSIKETLLKLSKLNLIEIDISSVATLDDDFYDYLLEQLIIAIGPMAEIIIDDVIKDYNISKNAIPVYKASEIIEYIADAIQRNDKKIKFQQNMLIKLKNL